LFKGDQPERFGSVLDKAARESLGLDDLVNVGNALVLRDGNGVDGMAGVLSPQRPNIGLQVV
jgi:hypothetical protein